LQINVATALGSGPLTNAGATFALGALLSLPNAANFSGNSVIDVGNPTAGADDRAMLGAWSGSSTVLISNLNSAARTFTIGGSGNGGGNMTNFSGTLYLGTVSGFIRFNDTSASQNLGSPNATFNLGTGSAILLARNGGVTIELGALLGGSGTSLQGRASGNSGTLTYSVGARNLDTTFDGVIADKNN